jgi:beta-glucosidase
VVQLYVHPPSGDRPVAELRGFAKVRLEPGETADVSLPLTSRDFAWFDTTAHGWRVDAGSYGIRVGRHSRDGVETPVAITRPSLELVG